MATKNLGQVSAIHIGALEPQNKNLIWRDISQNPNLWKLWNSLDSVWEVVPSQAVVNNFINLGDTPISYQGSGGKILKVKANLSGIEFGDEVTFLSEINDAVNKAILDDSDEFLLSDAGTVKKTLWSNIKSTIKAYFDTLYVSVSDVTSQLIANWNTAYGWGNHASAGYLTSETDPVFTAHPANNVTDAGDGTQYLANDGTYKTITVPDGSKWEDESLTLIRPKDGKKIDASHIEGLGQGGHTFEDSTGTALPTRSVAKAGAGIEFEDDADNEMTVVKLKEYIQPISFAITDTFTFKPALALSITSADISANISDLRVGKNGATPAAITYPYAVSARDILTFEVSFTDAYNRELSSFITLKGQYV